MQWFRFNGYCILDIECSLYWVRNIYNHKTCSLYYMYCITYSISAWYYRHQQLCFTVRPTLLTPPTPRPPDPPRRLQEVHESLEPETDPPPKEAEVIIYMKHKLSLSYDEWLRWMIDVSEWNFNLSTSTCKLPLLSCLYPNVQLEQLGNAKLLGTD